ncbi:MAG TPA: histidine kinase [Saprospiraceae bacterium]|nr:histidine kinase [Saprospiraceae bacterium]
MSQALIYCIKALVAYYCIYSIIPRWSGHQLTMTTKPLHSPERSSLKYFLEFIFVLLTGAFLMRLMVQYVIWIYVFPGEERILTFASLVGRYLYSLFDLIPITLVAVSIKLVQLRISALKQETILVQEKIKSELQYLKAQTNPHFLFNTLNGIYALSRKQDAQTPVAILNLSKILRYMLYETSHRTNPLRDELQLISDYIALQKLRFQEHLTITYFKNVEDEGAGISPLLLLPLVENAFKHSHGLHTHIDIRVSETNAILKFSISNTLSEQPDDHPLIKDGIGLNNIKRQLAILYREYTFSAYKTESDFTVDLMIRLNSYAHV